MNQFNAPTSNYPVKESLGPFNEEQLKQQFIDNTSLSSIIEPTGIYSSSGYVEWKRSPLNSLTFLVGREFGFDDSAIIHWKLGNDERGNISIDHTMQMIARFNHTFDYKSYAFRWPNSGITECLFRGDNHTLTEPLHEALGLKFDTHKKVGKGKKRMHIFGLSQGAFLNDQPSTGREVHLSHDCTLTWALEPAAINDTNDGGGSCTKSGLKKILDNSNIPYTDESFKRIDSVQIVIVTAEHIIKGIFVVVDDNVIPNNIDLLVPEPSLVYELISDKYTMGKVNLINRKKSKNWVTMEPLQVVPNFLNFTDHNEVAHEIHRASLQAETDIYNEIIAGKSLLEHYDQIVDDRTVLPYAFELDELHNLEDMEVSEEMRAFVKASAKAGNNSPYANTVLMEQTMSGTYRHVQKLIKHWKGLPGIIISGGRHYITYAPHAGAAHPPLGYLGIIYWDDKCDKCGSKTCHNHFERDIRRISINPEDCDAHTRDLLDGFDMDDSCFWALLRRPNGQLVAWIGRNPMSPDRGLVLAIMQQDENILMRRGYKALTQTGEWKIPNLWKIEETLKLGELKDIPKWTWDDKDDLETCFTLSSKTGGLGQLALYTSAFQYTGQWDVNRHHILNSNIVDAQVNADADVEWTVQVMHKDFVTTFVEEKKLMSKYIANRMERMFAATGINKDNFIYGNSPRLDAMATSLQITDNDLYNRDEIRKLLSNGTASRLTMQLNENIITIVLTLAKQVRHLWTTHFALISDYDAALACGDIDEDLYNTFVNNSRKQVAKVVKELIQTTYTRALELPNYNVGEFAAAWMQIQASKATRFRVYEDQKFARPISATPLINLPIEEILTCFYSTYTQPTWITRVVGNDFLIPGGVYSVEQDETGIIYLLDGDKNIAGTLLPESDPIVGQVVQYIADIPRHHNWTDGSTENWDARENCGVFNINHTVWQEKNTEIAG